MCKKVKTLELDLNLKGNIMKWIKENKDKIEKLLNCELKILTQSVKIKCNWLLLKETGFSAFKAKEWIEAKAKLLKITI